MKSVVPEDRRIPSLPVARDVHAGCGGAGPGQVAGSWAQRSQEDSNTQAFLDFWGSRPVSHKLQDAELLFPAPTGAFSAALTTICCVVP